MSDNGTFGNRFDPLTTDFAMRKRKQFETPPRRVALFVTCMVDMLYPDVGMAAVELLERARRRGGLPL